MPKYPQKSLFVILISKKLIQYIVKYYELKLALRQ